MKKYTNCVFFSKVNNKNFAAKKQKKYLNLWRIAQLLMQGFLMRIFCYCLKIKMKNENNKNKKKKWKTLLHVRHQVWLQFEGLWVRGVHWHPLGQHLTPGYSLTPLNLLKVPTKIPWFRNVSEASSVTPIWKPLGQGSSLASLRTTFDTWLPPDPFKPP